MITTILLLTIVALYYLGRYDLPRDFGRQTLMRGPRQKSRWLKAERTFKPVKLET